MSSLLFQSHHFSLLLLLVLQLHGHQSVVELGDLSPHHLNLIVHCQPLHTLRPQGGVAVHAASPLYPIPRGSQTSHPAVGDIPHEVVPVLRSGGGGVVGNLAELDGSKIIPAVNGDDTLLWFRHVNSVKYGVYSQNNEVILDLLWLTRPRLRLHYR